MTYKALRCTRACCASDWDVLVLCSDLTFVLAAFFGSQIFMASCVKMSTIMLLMMPLAVAGSLLPLLVSGGGPSPAPSQAAGADTLAAVLMSPVHTFGQYYGGNGQEFTLSSFGAVPTVSQSPGIMYREGSGGGGGTTMPIVIIATVLVAAGSAGGVPCSMSMATE